MATLRRACLLAVLALAAGVLPAVAAAAPGDLDTGFGGSGLVRTPIGDSSQAYAIGQQSDGKLVVAGCRFDPAVPSQLVVTRYTTSGALDPSFGENGIALVPFPDSSSGFCGHGGTGSEGGGPTTDLAIRPNDKIVLVGGANRGEGDPQSFAVAQLTPGGQLDGTFGDGGRVLLHPGDPADPAHAKAVVLEPNGRAIIAGAAQSELNDGDPELTSFAAVRIDPNGTPDLSFGAGGALVLELTENAPVGSGQESRVADIVRYADGRIALVGTAYDNWADSDGQYRYRLAAVRLDANGQLDPSFSGDGKLVTPVRGVNDFASAHAAALTTDDRLAVGLRYNELLASDTYAGATPLIARFEEDGALDSTFGSNGSTVLDFGHSGTITALGHQADGKLIAAGAVDNNAYFALARLDAAGEPDTSFGSDGIMLGPPFGPSDPWNHARPHDLLLDSSGDIVLVGYATADADPEQHIALARYEGNSPPPPPPPPRTHVALGDSYSSGHGVGNYEPGTHKDGDLYPANDCQRSAGAYGQIVAEALGLPIVFKACSGATTHDFFHPRDDREDDLWGESPQFDYLDSSTKLVTFSIGGNDADFAEHLAECILGFEILPWNTCSGDNKVTVPVREAFDRLAGGPPSEKTLDIVPYSQLFRDARRKAPFAIRVAVGYPEFFVEEGSGSSTVGDRCRGMKIVDQQWIVQRIRELNKIAQEAAEEHGFEFVVPSEGLRFQSHEFCGGGDEWFFPPLNPSPPPLKHPGAFHPTAEGQNAIAEAVLEKLANPEPSGEELTVASNETVSRQFNVADGKARLIASSEWPGSDVMMSLTSPGGQKYTRSDSGPSVEHENGPTWERFEIPNPEPGEWLVELYGADVPVEGEPVTLSTVAEDPPNIPPTARIRQHREGDRLTLDASDSTDADGQINDYDWYVSSAESETTAAGAALSLPAERPEGRTITLVVTDNEGATDFAAIDLAPLDHPVPEPTTEPSPEAASSPFAVVPALPGPAVVFDRRSPHLWGIRLQVRMRRGWRKTRVVRVRRLYRGRIKQINRRVRLVFRLSEDARVALRVRAIGKKRRWQRRRVWRLRSGRRRLSLTRMLQRARPGRYRLILAARDGSGNLRMMKFGVLLR